jgi:hypothetical protein
MDARHSEPIQDVLISSPYYLEYFKVQGTGTASILTHKARATLVDNGTGDYTITLREASGSGAGLVALACPYGSTVAACGIDAVTANSVRVKTYSHDGTALDADFYLFLFCPQGGYLHGNNYAPLMSDQPKTRIEFIRMPVTAGVPTLSEAPPYYSVADTDVGVYTLTSTKPFLREPHVFAVFDTAGFANVDSVDSDSFIVRAFGSTGTATDPASGTVFIMVVGNDDAREWY